VKRQSPFQEEPTDSGDLFDDIDRMQHGEPVYDKPMIPEWCNDEEELRWLQTPCPYCGAGPGAECITMASQKRRGIDHTGTKTEHIHRDRIKAAETDRARYQR